MEEAVASFLGVLFFLFLSFCLVFVDTFFLGFQFMYGDFALKNLALCLFQVHL